MKSKKKKKKDFYFINTMQHFRIISNIDFLKFWAQQQNIAMSLKILNIYLIYSLFLCPPGLSEI